MPRVKKGTSDPGTEFGDGLGGSQSTENQYSTNTKLTPAASLGAETRGQGQSTGTPCTDQPRKSGMAWSGPPSQAHLVGKLPDPEDTHGDRFTGTRTRTHMRAHEVTRTLTPEPLPASDLETGPGP